MPIRNRNQLAFDEQMVEDTALENALEDRERRRESLSAVQKAFDEAHEIANAEIAKLELPEGGAVRVGRFRITRNPVAARHVSFDAKATSRVRITLIGDEDEPASPRGSRDVEMSDGTVVPIGPRPITP